MEPGVVAGWRAHRVSARRSGRQSHAADRVGAGRRGANGDRSAAYPRGRTLLIGHLVAWTPEGRHPVVPDRDADAIGLVLIDTGSGQRTPLTSPAAGEFDVEPSLSS